MELIDRKLINNSQQNRKNLPHYELGTLPIGSWETLPAGGWNDYTKQLVGQNNPTGWTQPNPSLGSTSPVTPIQAIGGPQQPKTPDFNSWKNHPKPPKVAEASLGQAAPGIISGAFDLAQKTADASSYNKSQADLNTQAGTSQQSYGGESYTVQNTVDAAQEKAQVKGQVVSSALGMGASGAATGAAIGSIIPGIGTAAGAIIGGIGGLVGGIFAGKSKKRAMKRALERQRINAAIGNNYNQNIAQSNVMNRLAAEEYGDQQAQQLYLSKGKDSGQPMPHYNEGKGVTLDTAFGMVKGKPNAYTQKGEFIFDPSTLIGHTVQRGPNDNAPSYVRGKDAVITNKYGLSDAAREAYAQGDIEGVFDIMNLQRYLHSDGTKHYKGGKSSGGIIPWVAGGVTPLLGLGTSLAQYLSLKNEPVYKPNTYVPNTMGQAALQKMAGIRMNMFPIMNQLRGAESRGKYNLSNIGGLSGAQRYLANAAMAANTQNAIADALYKGQLQDNQYAGQYADMMWKHGANEAANRTNAMRADDDIFMRGNAAKQKMLYDIAANAYGIGSQMNADNLKRLQFNDMYGLYNQQLDLERKKQLKVQDNDIRI